MFLFFVSYISINKVPINIFEKKIHFTFEWNNIAILSTLFVRHLLIAMYYLFILHKSMNTFVKS